MLTYFKKKKHPFLMLILLACILPLFTPPARFLYSMAIMQVYSRICYKDSIPDRENIHVHIPGGLATKETDWYPFVMTFQDNAGFRAFTGKDNLSLTIMYNFPAFSLRHGCSRLYDTTSPFYNSFYGAYFVQQEDSPFGFIRQKDDSMHIDYDAMSLVPQFDFQKLVLKEFGLTGENAIFEWEITDTKEMVSYVGYPDFVEVDATLKVNGASHKKDKFQTSYLQYGAPGFTCESPLAPISMYGRIYGRYFKEWNCSVFFYIIAADKDVLENCDRFILSKSILY